MYLLVASTKSFRFVDEDTSKMGIYINNLVYLSIIYIHFLHM